jgi:hypothetical protein
MLLLLLLLRSRSRAEQDLQQLALDAPPAG